MKMKRDDLSDDEYKLPSFDSGAGGNYFCVQKKSRSKGAALAVIFMLLAACSADNDDLDSYLNDIKTRSVRPIEPMPEFVSPPKFTYPEDDKRRSPFKPIVVEQQAQESVGPNTNRPRQALEAFALDSLKFVGIIKERSIVWGLISQPSGLVSRVKPGDYIGKNYGQIRSIKESGIRIEETVQVAGKWEKKEITLPLHSPE